MKTKITSEKLHFKTMAHKCLGENLKVKKSYLVGKAPKKVIVSVFHLVLCSLLQLGRLSFEGIEDIPDLTQGLEHINQKPEHTNLAHCFYCSCTGLHLQL